MIRITRSNCAERRTEIVPDQPMVAETILVDGCTAFTTFYTSAAAEERMFIAQTPMDGVLEMEAI